LFLLVRFGRVASESPAGTFEFGAGTTAFISSAQTPPRTDIPLPPAIRTQFQQSPVPETIPVNHGQLFGGRPGAAPQRLYVGVREGSVSLTPEGGEEVVVEPGAVARLTGLESSATLLPTPPPFMRNIPVPPPEQQNVDMKQLFGARQQTETEPGLYVSVSDGHVAMSNEQGEILHLGRGEAGFADPQLGELVRLAAQPLFFINDAIPKPKELENWKEKFEAKMEDSFGVPQGEGQEECECEIVY